MDNCFIIVIVGDSQSRKEHNQDYVKVISEFVNVKVLEADSGDNAIQLFNEHKPDYIIFNNDLPDYHGLDYLLKLQQLKILEHTSILHYDQNHCGYSSIHAFTPVAFEYISKLNKNKYSYHDTLTGLLNVSSFEETVTTLISSAKRHERKLAVLSIDINHFKYINERYGKHIGDQILIETGERIHHYTRNEDILTRLSDDKFVLVLSDLRDYPDAGRVAQKIFNRISEKYYIEDEEILLTINVGIACYPENDTSVKELINYADDAREQLKITNTNQYQYYSPKLGQSHSKQIELESALSNAISNNEFYLLFQPVIDTKTNQIVYLESFLRWKNKNFSSIQPGELIHFAESMGIINDIENWVIDEACQCYANWQSQYHVDYNISINLSPKNFINADYIDKLTKKCNAANVPKNKFKLEINSNESFGHIEKLAQQVKLARASGFDIIIDNFGSGTFSFFDFIELLPLSAIKLNKILPHQATENKNKNHLIKSIMDFCTDLSVPVIAVGVENFEQKQLIEEYHCKLMQGFYFYELMTAKQIDSLLEAH